MRAKLVEEELNIQHEGYGSPRKEDWDMDVPCKACGKSSDIESFVHGVCFNCASQGIWLDKFGSIHTPSTKIQLHKAFESKNKK